jgi:hypothetical protein
MPAVNYDDCGAPTGPRLQRFKLQQGRRIAARKFVFMEVRQ